MKGRRNFEVFPAGKILIDDYIFYQASDSDDSFIRKVVYIEDIGGTNKCVVGLSPISMIWNEVTLSVDHGQDKVSAKLHSLGDLPMLLNNQAVDQDKFIRIQYEGKHTATAVFLTRKLTFTGIRMFQSPFWPEELEVNWKYGKSGN